MQEEKAQRKVLLEEIKKYSQENVDLKKELQQNQEQAKDINLELAKLNSKKEKTEQKIGELETLLEKNTTQKNIKSFIKKAKIAKSANIISNVTISSFLLAYALPKAQFAFRKLVTGSDLEPGLAHHHRKVLEFLPAWYLCLPKYRVKTPQ